MRLLNIKGCLVWYFESGALGPGQLNPAFKYNGPTMKWGNRTDRSDKGDKNQYIASPICRK